MSNSDWYVLRHCDRDVLLNVVQVNNAYEVLNDAQNRKVK